MTPRTSLLALAGMLAWRTPAPGANPGSLGKTEIVIGTIQDLSGPAPPVEARSATACSCAWRRPTSRAASMAARSGAQDSRTRVTTRSAVLAAQKLVDQEKSSPWSVIGHRPTSPRCRCCSKRTSDQLLRRSVRAPDV